MTATTQPEVTREQQIAWMETIVKYNYRHGFDTEIIAAILASLQRLQRIERELREPTQEMLDAAKIEILPSYEGQLDHQHAYDIVSVEDMKVLWGAMSSILLRVKP